MVLVAIPGRLEILDRFGRERKGMESGLKTLCEGLFFKEVVEEGGKESAELRLELGSEKEGVRRLCGCAAG